MSNNSDNIQIIYILQYITNIVVIVLGCPDKRATLSGGNSAVEPHVGIYKGIITATVT